MRSDASGDLQRRLPEWGRSGTIEAGLTAQGAPGGGQALLVAPPDVHRDKGFRYDVAIVGLGYVGLPTALALHAQGGSVLGFDVSAPRLAAVRDRTVDLLERDHVRLAAALRSDRFVMTDDAALLAQARAVVVCVPTPVDGHLLPDLSMLRSACETVVAHAVPGQLVVLTSTTYVGTTRDLVVTPLAERGLVAGRDVHVVFSPERIDPGIDEHRPQEVPRIVGAQTPACGLVAQEVLAPTAARLHVVSSPEAAEMTKLLENTFRAVNIAFVNEVADACHVLGLDVMEVISGAATKPYGFMPFYPGPGVGGHCIPCDPHYLLWQLRGRLQTPLIESAMDQIAARPDVVVRRARDVLDETGRGLRGARVLVLGVAYKKNVADVRESPALDIIDRLVRAGAVVEYHDPLVERIRLRDGGALESLADPASGGHDLVLVHTLHDGTDVGWLDTAKAVLDTTYRLDGVAGRDVP